MRLALMGPLGLLALLRRATTSPAAATAARPAPALPLEALAPRLLALLPAMLVAVLRAVLLTRARLSSKATLSLSRSSSAALPRPPALLLLLLLTATATPTVMGMRIEVGAATTMAGI